MKFLNNKEWNEFKVLREKRESLHEEMKKFEIEKKTVQMDIENKLKQLKIDRGRMEQEFELKEKKIVAAYEDKLSKELMKIETKHQRELTRVKEDSNDKISKEIERMLKKNYDKLSEATMKLHEEGNAQTKAVTELSKEVIKAVGLSNSTMQTQHLKLEHINDGKHK